MPSINSAPSTEPRHARNDAFSLWADYTAEMAA